MATKNGNGKVVNIGKKAKASKKAKANGTAPKRGVSDRLKKASELTGIEEEQIGTVNLQLSRLRQLGLLVSVQVSGISKFMTSATWNELGITDHDERKKRLRTGAKLLIREELYKELRSCESSYRQLLARLSFDVTGFMPYKWMPFTAYAQWRLEAKEIEARFDRLKRRIVTEYEKHIDELAEDERQMALRAWRLLVGAGEADAIRFGGKVYTDQDAFVDDVMRRGVQRFPSKGAINSGLKIDYQTAIVTDQGDIEADLLAATKARAETDEIEREMRLKDDEAQAKLEAMRVAELEHARKQFAEMKSPIDEVMTALRSRIKEAAEGMLDSVKKNGFVRGKVAEQGAGLLELFDLLAVGDDRDLRRKLEELKAKIGPVGKARKGDVPDREVDGIEKTLRELVGLAAEEATDLTISDRFGALEF